MKQIIQDIKNGDTILEEIPVPTVKNGFVLIKTHRSLVSLGTEKMLVEFGKSSLIAKARQQPDKVKMVLEKIESEGLIPTIEAVFKKLGEPIPLGYSNAGEVIGVGEGVTEFKLGDRVASNGQHAEIVNVPKNLVAKIPDNVSYDEASFTVIGAIGLQGIRLANPTFGESVVVFGLGLIGLITAELLLANGCTVIGFDLDDDKIQIAQKKGIKAFNSSEVDSVKTVLELTNHIGCDKVLITASTKSNDLISQSAKMCRKRGKIVLIGVVGLDISRADFYEKELEFQVSCSYGPGRYDDIYEQKGNDYPIGFVRWSENRNLQAVLEAISNRKLDVKSLISETVDLKDYANIYNNFDNGKTIASILKYPDSTDYSTTVSVFPNNTSKPSKGNIALIGAGNFSKMTLLPTMKKIGLKIKTIVSNNGLSGTVLAKKYGIEKSSTSFKDVLKDSSIDAVIIATRHNLHASMVIEALRAGKHVFVEKPLALNLEELELISDTYRQHPTSVMVGFNRRFAPFVQKAKKIIGNNQLPISINITVNAGFIPDNSWVHDKSVGGGRLIGEGCHFIDLMSFLSNSEVTEVCSTVLNNSGEQSDNISVLLKFKNGSQGVLNYWANGSKAYSKERIEVFFQGKNLIIDNYRRMYCYGISGFKKDWSFRMDKGHKTQFEEYLKFLKNGGNPLISFESLINTTKATIKAIESIKSGNWKKI